MAKEVKSVLLMALIIIFMIILVGNNPFRTTTPTGKQVMDWCPSPVADTWYYQSANHGHQLTQAQTCDPVVQDCNQHITQLASNLPAYCNDYCQAGGCFGQLDMKITPCAVTWWNPAADGIRGYTLCEAEGQIDYVCICSMLPVPGPL